MKPSIFNLFWIFLLGAACFLGGTFVHPDQGKPELAASDTMYLPGDSIPVDKYYPAPYPVYHDTGTTRWRNIPIDTMAILADYFSRNGYYRVLKDDTSAFAAISDTVTENKLSTYRFTFQNRRPTQIINNTWQPAPEARRMWYVGGSVGMMPDKILIMPGLAMQDLKQRIWFAKADIRLNAVEAGAFVPIWRRHPKKVPAE
jgi:hypothetical protein